jgi:glycosyltransferase involved in cell wall biosynthesis
MSTRTTKRIAFVTDEILGVTRNAGGATATTFLALALADAGHRVEVHFAAPLRLEGIAQPWRDEYERRDIAVRPVLPFPVPVAPQTFAVACAVEEVLRSDPPDVVIGDDRYGSCYVCLRTRSLGLGFEKTLFVIYCHGTTAWIADAHRKLRRATASFEVEALERATIELADIAVSPSNYMVEWMRKRGWRVPRPVVAPLLTGPPVKSEVARTTQPIRALAFFGRLEERKGLRPYLEALNRLDRDRLAAIELLFVGKETPSWDVNRVRASLPKSLHSAVRFETGLDQPEALELLGRAGTLAVMPSLVDNSPMVIYECLERGIPFLATRVGGGPELVVAADRERSFVEPVAEALAPRLETLLSGEAAVVPARPAFDRKRTLSEWEAVIDESPQPRRIGKLAGSDDFVLVVEDGDEPEPDCLEILRRAQAASGADVVTCGAYLDGPGTQLQLFLGDSRELGTVANHYGIGGLYRRDLLEQLKRPVEGDTHWLMLASLSLRGRNIVSVPRALVRSRRSPGSVGSDPVALAVASAFERATPVHLRGAPTLAAGLAARPPQKPITPSLGRRIRWILANEGAAGLLRRAARHVRSGNGEPAGATRRG